MSNSTPSLQPITPAYHLRILSDSQLEQMKSATLEILEETGVHCPSEKALRIFAEHGANVNAETQVVKIPPQAVLENMSHAPRFYTMGARRPEFDLKLDGKSTHLATDGCGVETIDFVTRQRRSSCKDDVAKMARISDYLTSIGFYWPIVSARDFPSTAPLHELDASYNNTVKHVQSETIMDAKMAKYAVEMACVIAGDEKNLRERPPLSLLVCCIAPLGLDRDGMESAMTLAEAGLPVGFMSMANVGSTGPATLAGTLVTGDAEIVAAMTLIQMAYPGAPVFHSMMPGMMHPRTGAYLATALEGTLLYPIGVELAHSWGVPSLAGVFATDGLVPGWQSGGEAASSLLLCALTGAETGSGLGLLESCTLLYPEEVILDNDIYQRIRIEAAGLDTSPEALALDVIREVGPRGFFLKHRHTRENMRRRVFSELTMSPAETGTASQPAKSGGYRDPVEVAQEKIKWILENHQPEPLEPDQQKELTRILYAADKAFE
jgi:trimethylamine--corrinoid protein Co-methyltransferase